MNVLNETLYRRLTETFGHVQIANAGEAIQLCYRPDSVYRQGRLRADVVHYGETYKVSCPFCPDTRHRLYINHHWGIRDEETNDDMLHLVHCFNEDCVNTRVVQKELHGMIFPRGVYGQNAKILIKPVKTPAPIAPASIHLPPHTKLSALPEDHRAITYLAERGFSPEELESAWGVCYCPINDTVNPHFAKGRIVVPVYGLRSSLFAGKDVGPKRFLAGWQARTLMSDPPKHVPKYLTAQGMSKSRLLYGLPQALKAAGPIVVCEGVTDVWRVGPGAVALFGKTISPAQIKLILRYFRDRPVVVLLDSDAADEAKKVCGQIRQAQIEQAKLSQTPMQVELQAVVVGTLPPKRKDPGDCTVSELKKAIENSLSG